jgi:hypothetical protein
LKGTFEYGQAYVALSRAETLENLKLKSYRMSLIKSHPDVKQFYDSFNNGVITTFSSQMESWCVNDSNDSQLDTASHTLEKSFRRVSLKRLLKEFLIVYGNDDQTSNNGYYTNDSYCSNKFKT